MAWRRPDQGLSFGFTAKVSHEGTSGNVPHFMAAMACGKDGVPAEQYYDRINAENFSSFSYEHFSSMLKKSANPRGNLFLQDGDPSQNSVKSRTVWDKVGARKFTIPDLNPIENMFHILKKKLHHDALELGIIREHFESFSIRVKRTLKAVPMPIVGRPILSFMKQKEQVLTGVYTTTKQLIFSKT